MIYDIYCYLGYLYPCFSISLYHCINLIFYIPWWSEFSDICNNLHYYTRDDSWSKVLKTLNKYLLKNLYTFLPIKNLVVQLHLIVAKNALIINPCGLSVFSFWKVSFVGTIIHQLMKEIMV